MKRICEAQLRFYAKECREQELSKVLNGEKGRNRLSEKTLKDFNSISNREVYSFIPEYAQKLTESLEISDYEDFKLTVKKEFEQFKRDNST